jgi:hypothetical protein
MGWGVVVGGGMLGWDGYIWGCVHLFGVGGFDRVNLLGTGCLGEGGCLHLTAFGGSRARACMWLTCVQTCIHLVLLDFCCYVLSILQAGQ